MRRFAVLSLLLSLLTVAAPPTGAQTRPRRVGQRPPATANAPAANAPQRTRTPQQQPQSAPAPQQEISEEVGDDEVVRVNTTLVTIPVSVMDRDGRYIPTLGKEDFRIYEDGAEQRIEYFATVEKPFTVALVIDTSSSTVFRLEEIQEAAIAFVNQLRPEDRVLVVSFDNDIRVLSEATSDRYALRSAIRRTRNGGNTKLYDAVDWTLKNRLNQIDGRKAIVLFTDGVDTASRRATYQSTLSDVEELDALIYPVRYDTYNRNADSGGSGGGISWPRRQPTIRIGRFPFPIPIPGGGTIGIGRGGGGGGGVGTSRAEYERGTRYLRELAERTGGREYEANDLNYLTRAFASIAEELRRQYSLGYYPQNQSAQAGRRQIRVRVNRPNLAVRARDSYIFKPSGGAQSQQHTAQDDDAAQRQRPQPLPELRRRQLTDVGRK